MSVVCKATVIQDGDIFTLGTHEHLHPKEREIRNDEKFSFRITISNGLTICKSDSSVKLRRYKSEKKKIMLH